jgi:hypothetical protein
MLPRHMGLGCKLLMVRDDEAFAKVKDKLQRNKWSEKRRSSSGAHLAVKREARRALNPWQGNSEWGRRAQAARLARMTPEARSIVSV